MAFPAFYMPASAEQALQLARRARGAVRFVAGGTDLMCEPTLPETLVNLQALLSYTRREGDGFVIGATTTVSQIEACEELADAEGGLLRQCARQFATPQICNMATIGGNLVSAVPSADFAPPLLALEAGCVIQGHGGTRTVPLESFFVAPHQCVIGSELLLEIRFPIPRAGVRCAFMKVGRNPGDIATVNVATLLEVRDNVCVKVRMALGAVAPTPMRARKAEEFLAGKRLNEANIQIASTLACDATTPISDQRASAAYRRHMSRVLTQRALQQCVRMSR